MTGPHRSRRAEVRKRSDRTWVSNLYDDEGHVLTLPWGSWTAALSSALRWTYR